MTMINFGDSVAISGDTVVVGAALKMARAPTGAAYVFERNQGGADNWGQRAKLTASDRQDRDHFGYSVAISGNTVIVGANGETAQAGAVNRGAAYLFVPADGQWQEVAIPHASVACE